MRGHQAPHTALITLLLLLLVAVVSVDAQSRKSGRQEQQGVTVVPAVPASPTAERRLREEQQKLQAEQERLRREREKLQDSGAPQGTQVAVGVYPQSPEAPKTLRNSIGMEFVRIEAGIFQLGSNDGNNDEKPVHTVRISQPFYLGKYEVTQAQWEAVMGYNPSQFRGDANLPVEICPGTMCKSSSVG